MCAGVNRYSHLPRPTGRVPTNNGGLRVSVAAHGNSVLPASDQARAKHKPAPSASGVVRYCPSVSMGLEKVA